MSRIYNYCIHLLARQDYSEYKLRQKLRSKPQNLPHEIDEAIAELKSKGMLKEENYRRLFIRKWMFKGESEDKIRKRGAMEQLTFEEGEFESISQELGFSDEESLDKLIQKKLRGKEIPVQRDERYKLREKVLRFLISKGHTYDEAKRALENHFKSRSSE
jgi:regulatory protein